ncbi:MAG TPA: SufD family Fe-S cluster assembly protein [Acidimicrobiales bacterium]
MPAFTADLARTLGGPSWLVERRLEAVERFSGAAWPTTEEEIWRYSRIDQLDLDAFAPAAGATGCETTVEGAAGLLVGPADAADLVGSVMTDAPDVFAELNTAFMTEPLVVCIPAGKAVADTVVITHQVTGHGMAVFPRLVIDAGPDSEVTVVERFTSGVDVKAFVAPVLELRARQAARVRYLAVNELGQQVWQIASQAAVGERDSTTLMGAVALGGDYARVRTENVLEGQGASARQIAVFFAEADQMHDFRTIQTHVGPRTTSDLLFKGAVAGRSRSVYTGLIEIGHEAKGANAFQTNRNLKLSDGAWSESVPNLDIKTNDVRCSHASTVGPIDEDQRFYLESRGVPPIIAERLIVLGFFDEVLDQLPAPGLIPALRRQVMAKLDRKDA